MNTQEKKQLTQQAITNFALANFFLNEAEKKALTMRANCWRMKEQEQI